MWFTRLIDILIVGHYAIGGKTSLHIMNDQWNAIRVPGCDRRRLVFSFIFVRFFVDLATWFVRLCIRGCFCVQFYTMFSSFRLPFNQHFLFLYVVSVFFTLVIQYHPFSVGFVSLRIPFPYLMFFLLFFFNISQKNFYKILLMRINSTTLCIQWVAGICKEINETLISLMLRETLEVPVALHADFASIPVIEHESQNKLMF